MAKKLIILGAGGFAREVAWLAKEINLSDHTWEIAGFLEQNDEKAGTFINGIPVLHQQQAMSLNKIAYVVCGIGHPEVKKKAIMHADSQGLTRYATLIHPNVRFDTNSVEIGAGCVICSGNILTVNIILGVHVTINLDCTIGHDCIIGDYATLSPGCHLSGYTTVQSGAYLGTGACTIERRMIGAWSTVGAGAVVIKNIPEGATAVGIPAVPITKKG